jgi:hypothetical protein
LFRGTTPEISFREVWYSIAAFVLVLAFSGATPAYGQQAAEDERADEFEE